MRQGGHHRRSSNRDPGQHERRRPVRGPSGRPPLPGSFEPLAAWAGEQAALTRRSSSDSDAAARSTMTEEERVRTELVGRILVITMTRASKRNVAGYENGGRARCGLQPARGRRQNLGRCVGLGRTHVQRTVATSLQLGTMSQHGEVSTGLVRWDRRRPLVAAVGGPALGRGFELVLARIFTTMITSVIVGVLVPRGA